MNGSFLIIQQKHITEEAVLQKHVFSRRLGTRRMSLLSQDKISPVQFLPLRQVVTAMPGRWSLRKLFRLFYHVNDGITSSHIHTTGNHIFYFLAHYLYIYYIYVVNKSTWEGRCEGDKKKRRAGDGARTRDSLLGRQGVTKSPHACYELA